MITLRRAEERHHDQSREQEVWLTFSPHGRAVPFVDGFGTTGDGAGVRAERAVSLTAQEETEILLFDLREPLPDRR